MMLAQRICVKMIIILLCCILSCTANQNAVNGEYLSCRGEEILSANRTLAPFELVTVSKNVTSPPNLDYTRVYNFGYDQFLDAWCTDNFDPIRQVQLGFTMPVLITGMISGGRIESGSANNSVSYVTRFTLEYSSVEDPSQWFVYTISTGDSRTQIKPFLVPEINTFLKLERPILTQRIRLTIEEWYDAQHPPGSAFQFICQGLAILGCLASEITTITDFSSYGGESQTAATMSNNTSSNISNNTSNSHVIIGLLAITVVIINILILVVIFLGYKLVRTRKELADKTGCVYAHLDRPKQNNFVQKYNGRRNEESKDTNTTAAIRGHKTSAHKEVINLNYEGVSEVTAHAEKKFDIYSTGSSYYEHVDNYMPQTTEEQQNGVVQHGSVGAGCYGLDTISEESGEIVTSLSGNRYELVDSHSTLNRTSLFPPENKSQFQDSMISNSAYNKPKLTATPSGQEDFVEGDGEGGEEEEEPYEALVQLQRNSSYNYVPQGGTPVIPKGRGPDYYNTTVPPIVIDPAD